MEEDRFVADHTNRLMRSFSLPDGTVIGVNRERFLGPEIFFKPQFAGDSDSLGISSAIREAVSSTAMDLRSGFYRSIILAGGSSMTRGFSNRLKSELSDHDPAIDECSNRQFLAFLGGSIVAEINDVSGPNGEWWIQRSEYLERGAANVISRFAI